MAREDLVLITVPIFIRFDTMVVTGIYLIWSYDARCYVGSAVNVFNRWSTHEVGLEEGTHYNCKLQAAWNKYGPGFFVFELIEVCDKLALLEREQFWLDNLQPFYNIERIARSALGRKMSNKSKLRARLSALVVAAAPEERQRRSDRAKSQHKEGNFGQATWSSETKQRWRGNSYKIDRSKSVQGLRDYWKDPGNCATQSQKLAMYCQAHSEEMARRSKLRWAGLSKEDRKAWAANNFADYRKRQSAETVEERRARMHKTMGHYYRRGRSAHA